jgi:DNA-binding NarL/FixJ family response regulator
LLFHEPVFEQDGEDAGPRERLGVRRAAWLIPAPSPQDSDALGLLILASDNEQRLEVTRRLLPVYRALALALSDWFQRRGREELVRRAHLTDRDIDLLRRESLGQGSKRIASALHAEPKTIDCRFHRLNLRLGVASRREAVRLCKRYGLL